MRHVDGFEPISLPALESHAGLQARVDRKYIVDFETLERLLAQLGDDYLALEIDGERLQQYDSVYFDTPALTRATGIICRAGASGSSAGRGFTAGRRASST